LTRDIRLLGVERGVEAGELEVCTVPQSVEQSGHDGCRLAAVVEAFGDVEVVLHLSTVVAALGVGAVMVADGWEDWRARDGEA
jgi:hypothetical protein